MYQSKMAQKQMTLAETARANSTHRFTNLYSLLHWDCWIRCAAEAVLARPGSHTAGVDGITRFRFRDTYEHEVTRLIADLKRKTYTPQPVRRVYIPKADGRPRPLGIPALRDRIVQEALRAVLDPIYESDFHPHSYGFRKGRRTMDAIAVVMRLTNAKLKYFYAIEGDIKGYFDAVQHRKLLSILKRRIADADIIDLIWKFLKAGVLEEGLFATTESGVPQGGVISPLLANIYLNEFDQWADRKWNLSPSARAYRREHGSGNYKMVRYADDFVVMSNDGIAGVRVAKEEIRHFLATELHLELSEAKTSITHVNAGFDFLGFHIQRVRSQGRMVVHLRPTDQAKRRVMAKVKDLTSRKWTWQDEYTKLTHLNTIVHGWAEYYRFTSLQQDIEDITWYTWHRYLKWLLKKHKGSRKQQLVTAKTARIHNRTRWTAELREGDKRLHAHQWLATRKELRRERYVEKGTNGFPHPYIPEEEAPPTDYPIRETGPAASLYSLAGLLPNRSEPQAIVERKLRAKLRDDFTCVRCGSTTTLQVHHRRGMKSHQMENLETLCLRCHHAEHGYRQRQRPDGAPDVVKATRPVRREG